MSQTHSLQRKPTASAAIALEVAEAAPNVALSQQYGGIHSGGWVDMLPKSWIPYIQLSRLSPPVGFFLIYLPHLFGVIHAASIRRTPLGEVLHVSAVLFGGSFFCNNGSHAWNDLVDSPIDAKIGRTKTRPIPRGDISRMAAFVFACTQALFAAPFLLLLPYDAALAAIPTIVGTLYYPFAKRHTHLPQVVLGFCLTWGIMVGSSSMGTEKPWTDTSTVCLLVASIFWVILFDTIYAHQDLAGDLKVGVKSLAVLLNGNARPFLWTLVSGMGALLYLSGVHGGMGFPYYLITVGGCISSVGTMVALVNLEDPQSCWQWFSNGFWFTGASIVTGLLANYAVS
ncbi:hypothetical protein DL769_008191 [Monosporascus sp. CRB-8-3]|nr:hypothetical protein DL769_008191 [Monosporascus sp. CRB-8-3]